MKIPVTIAITGGIAVIASTFLPVADMSFETLSLWHPLVNEVAYGRSIAVLLVICGLMPVITRLSTRKKYVQNWIGLGAGFLTVTAAIIFLARTMVLEIQGYGLYLLLAGGCLVITGEMWDFRRKLRP